MERKNEKIILDTSYLVALIDRNDALHKKAIEIPGILERKSPPIITNYIYIELATILSQRIGKKFDLQKHLNKSGIYLEFVSEDIFIKTMNSYPHIEKKDISFVDLLTAIYCKENHVSKVITFDKHFKHLANTYSFEAIGI